MSPIPFANHLGIKVEEDEEFAVKKLQHECH